MKQNKACSIVGIIQILLVCMPEVEDSRWWILGEGGRFSVGSCFKALVTAKQINFPWERGLGEGGFIKGSAFYVDCSSRRIMTINNLQKRGMYIPNICLFG